MAQVPGLGLDQSQLADVINQQYKGYSQKQRNQMMQSAAATPDNWGSITEQVNKTATQPTEFLGAGRLNNIPTVSKYGQQLQRVDSDTQQNVAPWMSSNHTAPYQNEFGSYYDQASYKQYQNAVKARDWVNTYINPTRMKTEIHTPKQGEQFNSTGWTYVDGGVGETGVSSPGFYTRQVQDTPIQSWQQLMDTYGKTPSGGWSDANTKGVFGTSFGRKSNPLQTWLSDVNAAPNFSLYGSGSPTDIQRGFNILQGSAPQNIGEFWSMSPEVQKGILENPGISLQQMRATANPANRDWLSIGAEGGLRDISNWEWNKQRGLSPTPGSYLQVHDENNGLLGSFNSFMNKVDPLNGAVENTVAKALGFDNGLDMVRQVGEPVGNLAGVLFSGGIPWGSIVAGVDNISTGNDKALLGNIVNGLVSYGGTQVNLGGTGGSPVETAVGSSGTAANSMAGSGGGVFGSGVSLGSTAANQAAQGMLMNAGANYAKTGDLGAALKSAAFSGASGAAGNWLGNATQGQLGEIGSKALGGAASGGLSSLFASNSPVNGSLFGAMSGGLHGFLNSTDKQNNTFNKERDIQNRRQAQNLTKLAKLFVKK